MPATPAAGCSPAESRCLELAERSVGLSEPNPRVGCLIVTRQGDWVEGHTQAAGQAHAEAHALLQAQQRGLDVRGAEVFVTLEPCSHQGRTPPCSAALVAAGVARVHVAHPDPNPLVSGQGLAQLRAAGIEVRLDSGAWRAAARPLNLGFFSRMQRHQPWVRMKTASSLDGTTALTNGSSQWITGPEARQDGHHWRRRAGAVLTGMGTVKADNPRLDVRGVDTAVQPLRVVLDSRLELEAKARVLQPPGRCLVFTVNRDERARRTLEALPGVEVVVMEDPVGPTPAKTDLAAVLHELARRGVNELHLEAGEKLNGSFLRAGLVDEWLMYLAPKVLGPGQGLASVFPQGLSRLDEGLQLAALDQAQVGTDLRLRWLTARGQAFWPAGPAGSAASAGPVGS